DGFLTEVVTENEGSFINQSASFSNVNVFETGNGNAFFITQQGGINNTIGVNQQGDENYVTMNQNGSSLFASVGHFGSFNTVTSTQTDVGNTLYVQQFGRNSLGTGNQLFNTQSGTGNFGSFLQSGTNNLLNNTQSGVGNQAFASQFGTNNTLNNTQSNSGNLG